MMDLSKQPSLNKDGAADASITIEALTGLELNPWATEIDEYDWRLDEIPPSLKEVDQDEEPEIRRVVDEFWQHCEIFQASAKSLRESVETIIPGQGDGGLGPSSSHSRKTSDESALGSEFSGSSELAARSSMSSLSLGPTPTSLDKGKGPAITFEDDLEKHSRRGVLRRLLKGKIVASMTSQTFAPSSLFKHTPKAVRTAECASCFDDFPERKSIALGCKHSYCSECFVQLVRTSMQNENFWPPKCCLQEIPRKTILTHLSDDVVRDYGMKVREFGKPAKDRWYCTRPTCGLWFEGAKLGSIARCPHCEYEMCVHCRGEKHAGNADRCPQDKGQQMLEAEAELEGWRQCYSCSAMVELSRGCRHITCNCGAEFCYTCGARWRTCSCTEDDQTRRREYLASRREAARKDAAELEAALEAVAREERATLEQQLMEERRFFEALEASRVESIKGHYVMLRDKLAQLLQIQIAQIENQRQHQELAESQARAEEAMEALAELEADIEAAVQGCKGKLRQRRNAHAVERNATISRHRTDSAQLAETLRGLQADMLITERSGRKHTEALQLEQQKELNELWSQQNREAERLENNIARARSSPAFEARGANRVAQQKQASDQADERVRTWEARKASDDKWVDLARSTRRALLDEGERKLIASGGGVPEHEIIEPELEAPAQPCIESLCSQWTVPSPSSAEAPAAESSKAGALREQKLGPKSSPSVSPSVSPRGSWPASSLAWERFPCPERCGLTFSNEDSAESCGRKHREERTVPGAFPEQNAPSGSSAKVRNPGSYTFRAASGSNAARAARLGAQIHCERAAAPEPSDEAEVLGAGSRGQRLGAQVQVQAGWTA